MVAHDCGEIPVCDEKNHPLGVVTDRDITVRTVALGLNPLEKKARDVMSSPCHTVDEDSSLGDCCDRMESLQLRRMLVVDGSGRLCGIVALADVALHAGKKDTGALVQDVSKPAGRREPVNV
jgi:CBS domain-containing protein